MTANSASLNFAIHPGHGRRRPQWLRALRALRKLLNEPNRTELAFEVNEALDGDPAERTLLCMLAHPEGRRLYEERPALLEALSDQEALARLPENSFGRAYLEHVKQYDLDPRKLVELGRRTGWSAGSSEPGLRWIAERDGLMHDLWHVLTGYGADQLGEAALLPFSFAQDGGRGNALLTLGSTWRSVRAVGLRWLLYAWRSWRRGRRAICLTALPYEELLALPLDEVRAAAGIEPPKQAHRGGIYRGNPLGGA